MIYKLIFILSLFVASALCSCDNTEPVNPDVQLPIVVEGWIEDGENPVVIVTRAIDLTADLDSLTLDVQKWCRVTVSDGTHSEILTGRLNDKYIPSFIYTTTNMRGETGHTYTLKIETEKETVTAASTILSPVRIDSLKITRSPGCDTLFQIHAFAQFNREDGSYYKFFTKVNSSEKRYYSSFLGTFEGRYYNPDTGYSVSKGIHMTGDGEVKFTPYYSMGDTVAVKLCTIDSGAFDFWNSYENAVSMSGNLIFSFTGGCPTNLTGGAKGYWNAYGASVARIIITENRLKTAPY